MSIEEQLAALNENLRALNVNLAKRTTPGAFAAAAPEHSPMKPGARVLAGDKIVAPPVKEPEPERARGTLEAPGPIPYTDVQRSVLNLASKKGQPAAIKVLSALGLKSAKDAKPEQYVGIIEACDKAAVE